jgi:RNA polymerase sigma factor for flagellar operon FliA
MAQQTVATEAPSPETDNDELWTRFIEQRDRETRDALVRRYQPLVTFVVARIALKLSSTIDRDDALAEGTIGLIEAVDRFDPDGGVKFQTYAFHRIRGAIIDMFRRLDPQSRSARKLDRARRSATEQLTQDLGREPTMAEVAQALGMSTSEYRPRVATLARVEVPLDPTDATAEAPDRWSDLPDPDAEDITRGIEQEEQVVALARAVRQLPKRDQVILSLRFQEELTLREIGDVMGLSGARISQLQAKAISKLRTILDGEPGAAAVRPKRPEQPDDARPVPSRAMALAG